MLQISLELLNIKRKNKKEKFSFLMTDNQVKEDDSLSINQHMQDHVTSDYKRYVQATVGDISSSLKKLSNDYP